jgi:23S rRNA (cytosine1962-C5)-methyltransferase
VIIDPPYRQGASFRAERDWPKTLRKLPGLLSENGEIIAAVSAPELGRRFLEKQFDEHLPQAELVAGIIADADFPEADPDKGLHVRHYRLGTLDRSRDIS